MGITCPKDRLGYSFGNDDMHQLGDVNKSYNIIYEDIAYESMRKAIDNGQFVPLQVSFQSTWF